ncbi:GAP1-N2 domain-containing protein [Corynebacterium comes]|uniref:Uncharacterized protein n=1 Tax=Corynebacterium comes TaxID=2675218 RepID=A0A6B8W0P1_9CORY|nr:hypothetical protein [Corynebacterium comes]QGU05577.1 hypothetical protein CETAM_11725 [Corynebacterium comes]
MTEQQRRWSHVTYASFRNRAGGGGWHTGPSVAATQADEQLVVQYAPTSVVPTMPVDDFIGAAEIADLPRRFEYLPLEDMGLFIQSVPAGKDATGRPGNVFTHAFIDHVLAEPLAAKYPINLYGSPDLQTPFRIASVDAVELDAELQEPRPGPLTDLSVAWTMVTTMLGDRSGALFRLQDVLVEDFSTPVLTVRNANEAVYWLQALSSTLSPGESRKLLRFSTFERAQSLPAPLPGLPRPVLVVPDADKEALRRREGITVIDPADPDTQQASPGSAWSILTKGLVASGLPPQTVVELLEEPAPTGALTFGDALARMVRGHAELFGEELVDVAKQHLAAAKKPRTAEPHDADLTLVRRVVADPQLVLYQQVWPQVAPPKMSEREFAKLGDAALDGIGRLREVPREVLVGYLNFLLRTGLVPVENTRDKEFRNLFSDFDSFRGAPHLPAPPSAHPELPTLLSLADADRKQALGARQLRSEHVTGALGCDRSLEDITAWLRTPVAREALRTWIDDKVILRSSRDFSYDLLRVYYTVCIHLSVEPFISGDRKNDERLCLALGELMVHALEKGLQLKRQRRDGQPVTTGEFVALGHRIAREDLLPAEYRPVLLDRIVAEVREHGSPDRLEGLSTSHKQIVAAVARGITEQMSRSR